MKHGADINGIDASYGTMLHLAAARGSVTIAKKCVELGANIHGVDDVGKYVAALHNTYACY